MRNNEGNWTFDANINQDRQQRGTKLHENQYFRFYREPILRTNFVNL